MILVLGHIHLATAVAIPSRSSTAFTCDGLTVAVAGNGLSCVLVKATVVKGQDIHADMAGSTSAEGLENHVSDSLRSARVVSAHRGLSRWISGRFL